jgi:hypothetical protein
MIKVLRYNDIVDHKPQKPVRVAQHTYLQALEKTLDLMSVGHALKYKRYDPSMEKLTLDLLIKLCDVLNMHKVQYMIVGGTAVGFYEYTRLSHPSMGRTEIKTDIDIWYQSNYENRLRIVRSLEALDFPFNENDRHEMGLFSDPQWDDMLMIDQPNFKLDFIPYSKGLDFSTSIQNAKTIELAGVKIPFIGYDDLIKTKSLVNRPGIDDRDISELEKIRKRNEKRKGPES